MRSVFQSFGIIVQFTPFRDKKQNDYSRPQLDEQSFKYEETVHF